MRLHVTLWYDKILKNHLLVTTSSALLQQIEIAVVNADIVFSFLVKIFDYGLKYDRNIIQNSVNIFEQLRIIISKT